MATARFQTRQLTLRERTVPNACPQILVAAYGNELAGDDSFGPLVVEALRAMATVGVEVISLGMRPASLLDHLAQSHAHCASSTPPAATSCRPER